MIIALTGHRSEDSEDESIVRRKVRRALSDTPETVEAVITGMANGLDLWGGDEALKLGLPVIAARPWTTHQPREHDAQLYVDILANALRVVTVTEVDTYPGPWVYHKRNEWMVDNATHVMAYWSGKEKGGTFACVRYARKVKKPIRNIYNADEGTSTRFF